MNIKKITVTAAASFAVLTVFGAVSCAAAPDVTAPITPEVSAPEVSDGGTERSIRMSVSNGTNRADAVFTAGYTDKGILLTAEVTDSDVYTGVVYSYGYDDNVEYLVNLKTASPNWDSAGTFHFLITADGDTFLQKANSPGGFGASYALDLKCVNGGNFSYSAERTDGGYRTEVFLGYDLLGTDKETAYGNLCVCPAMRNTHDYADTVWASYNDNGCNWSNASSFIRVFADGYGV